MQKTQTARRPIIEIVQLIPHWSMPSVQNEHAILTLGLMVEDNSKEGITPPIGP